MQELKTFLPNLKGKFYRYDILVQVVKTFCAYLKGKFCRYITFGEEDLLGFGGECL